MDQYLLVPTVVVMMMMTMMIQLQMSIRMGGSVREGGSEGGQRLTHLRSVSTGNPSGREARVY